MRSLASAVLLLISTAAVLTGRFEGTWASAGSQGGDIHFNFTEQAGEWRADVGFTYEGEEIACKVVRLVVTGPKFTVAYAFDLGGYRLVSTAEGELSGDAISGKYETKTAEGDQPIDSGTWKAARK
jgi:hypothetical protein